MIGEVFVSVVLAGIFFTWLSVIENIWTDHLLDIPLRLFLTVFLSVIGAIAVFFVCSFIPTSTIDQLIPPEEYDHMKNEQAAIYLYENDYRYTEDAYLFENAEDSSKVELTQTKWKNIQGQIIGTTINVNQK